MNPVYCRQCKQVIPINDRFCGHCGANQVELTVAPTAPLPVSKPNPVAAPAFIMPPMAAERRGNPALTFFLCLLAILLIVNFLWMSSRINTLSYQVSDLEKQVREIGGVVDHNAETANRNADSLRRSLSGY